MRFAEEYKKLQSERPRITLLNVNSENSAFTNYSSFNKNCYMCVGTHYCEDCFYLEYSVKNTDCMDCTDIEKCELLYECTLCEQCYNCSYSGYLFSSNDCDYCWDMANSSNCFLCTSMQNKSYCILNEQYSPEEYKERKNALLAQFTAAELLQKLADLRKKVPQRFLFQKNCENCVGPDLRNCRNMYYSFAAKNSEDCMYTLRHVNNVKDGVDIECIAANPCEELYNCIGISGVTNAMCCWIAWFSSDLYYCEQVWNSNHLLGCIARNHAQYEILNQKYSKEDWHKKFAEIKDELLKENLWGKMWIEPTYPYEDTLAAMYYPKTQ